MLGRWRGGRLGEALSPGRLRRRASLAEAVADLSHRALGADEPDVLLTESLKVAVRLVGADYGTAVRRLPDGRMRVAQELGPQALEQGTILQLAPHRSYILRIVETGEPFMSVDLRRDPRVAPPSPLLDRGVVSGLAVPVRGPHGVTGVLALHSRRRRRFSRDDVAATSALASVVATAWEQVEQRERLVHQALHDPLTGLPNRTLFLDRLDQALKRRPPTYGGTVSAAVMLIDLDGFKKVNDSHGHAAGDRLLSVVAARFSSVVRPQDTISRLGGDEFGLLCVGPDSERSALRLADRLQSACRRPIEIEGSSVTVTSSIGVSSMGLTGAAAAGGTADLLGEADVALYRAKELGGAQVHVFDARLQRSMVGRRTLESELQQALVRQEFRLFYQPVRRATDLHAIGVEALLRWQHPSRGLVAPEEFIPSAERTGLIVPLGDWVLRTACREIARWQEDPARSGDPLWVAVNVSPRQLIDPSLPTIVAAARDKAGLAADSLVLELTESAVLPDDHAHHHALSELRRAGAQLFLDDFGTGYSSLTHLTSLPIQAVKIDRSFVAGLATEPRKAAVVSALIALSADVQLQVIAEGVETLDHLRRLQRLHCPAVQGFMLDRPSRTPHLPPPALPRQRQPSPRGGAQDTLPLPGRSGDADTL